MRKMKKILAAVLAAALTVSMVPENRFNSYAEETEGFLAGDADESGKVNAEDALTVLKHVVGIIVLDEETKNLADADASGEVNAEDALVVLKYVVGILEAVPAGCTEHTYGKSRVVKAATLTEEGIMAYTCMKCGYVKEEPIPVLEACTEHVWDDGVFIEHYIANGSYCGSYCASGWVLSGPSHIPDLEDELLDFRIFSSHYISREEGLKEYTCQVCGEKTVDFYVEKRSLPVEEESVAWEWFEYEDKYGCLSLETAPAESGWTGKSFYLYPDAEMKADWEAKGKYYSADRSEYIGLREELFTKEQELALDELSARFVSGGCGLWEYEAAVRAYLSSLELFDTSQTKGELLLGFQIFFSDALYDDFPRVSMTDGKWAPVNNTTTYVTPASLPFQYVYLNSYCDKEALHSVGYAITLYVKNPVLEK